jgi:hypothetical protein
MESRVELIPHLEISNEEVLKIFWNLLHNVLIKLPTDE